IVTTQLSLYPALNAPNIIANGNVLSVQSGLAGYQWYQSGAPVANAISNSLAVISNGNYYVVVTDANGCSVKSNVLPVTVGLSELLEEVGVQVYPNPTDGKLNVVILGLDKVSLSLYNALGE